MEKQSPMLRLWELGEKELDYLLVLDWRMALLSLVSIPVGMIFMMAVMKDYGVQYEGFSENDSGHEFNYCRVYWRYRGH